jgi:hypothetical protein
VLAIDREVAADVLTIAEDETVSARAS